jgi:hypothetical protein
MRQNNLNFRRATAGAVDEKCEPLGSEEGHVAAENEIPFSRPIGGGGVLQRGDDAPEWTFAGPLIFDRFQISAKVAVLTIASDNQNFCHAGVCELDNFQQQWPGIKANERLVATKPRTGAASENVGAQI